MRQGPMAARITMLALLVLALGPASVLAADPDAPEGDEAGEAMKPVVALVNGSLITRYDVEWELGPASRVLRGTEKERQARMQELREHKMVDLVLVELMIQAARRHGIKITDAMLRREVNSRAKEAGGMANYHRRLRQKGLTFAENWEEVRRELYVQEYQRRLFASRTRTQSLLPFPEIRVSPKEVWEYFERNPKEFEEEKPGVFRVLWLKFEDYPTHTETRKTAEAFRRRILEAGSPRARAETFGALARKHSNGEFAGNGGAAPLTHEPALTAELHAELLDLEEGEVSESISTEFGVFLLMIETDIQTVVRPFDEVRGGIRNLLRNKKLRRRLKEDSDRLLRSASIWPEEIARLIAERLEP